MMATQEPKTVAFVLYPGLTLLDLVGPLQVFASLRQFNDQYRPVVVAERLEPMATDGPLKVIAAADTTPVVGSVCTGKGGGARLGCRSTRCAGWRSILGTAPAGSPTRAWSTASTRWGVPALSPSTPAGTQAMIPNSGLAWDAGKRPESGSSGAGLPDLRGGMIMARVSMWRVST
jgi:hypothetical protein